MKVNEVYVAAIMFGQTPPRESDLKALSEILGVPLEVSSCSRRFGTLLMISKMLTGELGPFGPHTPRKIVMYSQVPVSWLSVALARCVSLREGLPCTLCSFLIRSPHGSRHLPPLRSRPGLRPADQGAHRREVRRRDHVCDKHGRQGREDPSSWRRSCAHYHGRQGECSSFFGCLI
jgi:hypothetical protein